MLLVFVYFVGWAYLVLPFRYQAQLFCGKVFYSSIVEETTSMRVMSYLFQMTLFLI